MDAMRKCDSWRRDEGRTSSLQPYRAGLGINFGFTFQRIAIYNKRQLFWILHFIKIMTDFVQFNAVYCVTVLLLGVLLR
jgi:hypothetical protein